MAATIRLMRIGKRGHPNYRIVVMDKRKKRTGSYIEKIGFYNPLTNPAKLAIDKQRFDYWVTKGAELSEGIMKLKKNLLKSAKSANHSQ